MNKDSLKNLRQATTKQNYNKRLEDNQLNNFEVNQMDSHKDDIDNEAGNDFFSKK